MKFLYICGTLACVFIIIPIHPMIAFLFMVVGAFVVSKLAIDKAKGRN